MKKTLWLLALPILMLASCSKDKDEDIVDTTPISLYVNDTKKVEMSFTPSVVSSENKFIADVEQDGTVSGEHVGITNVLIDSKYTIPVEVKGKITTYDDPVTKWGCDAAYIKANHKQGTFSSASDDENLVYDNCGKSEFIMYAMEEGKLVGVGVAIRSIYASEMGEYLAERYFMIPYDLGDYTIGGFDAYKMEDAKTVAAIKVYSTRLLQVVYFPNDKNDTKSGAFVGNHDLIKKIDNITKKYLSE